MIGEGELTLSELLPALARAGAHRLHDVPGIAFRDEAGAIVRTRSAPSSRISTRCRCRTARPSTTSLYLDAWKTHHGASSINLITARGCPYRCNWCSHAVYGYTHRRRSPAAVADEMQAIVDRYDPDQVWYADDVFTISHPWLAELRGGARAPRNPAAVRDDHARGSAAERDGACSFCGELGCYRIWIGSESGSQRILDGMERGVTVEQVRHSTKLAQAHGIQVGMFLMWGYEGEELEDIAATVEHVKRSNPGRVLDDRLVSDQGHGVLRESA